MFRFIGNRRPVVAGLILGTVLGLMVAVGYGATSGWLCSGISKCPGSWEPFVIVSSIIFVLILVATTIASVVMARLYKIFDTSIGGEKAYEPSIGTDMSDSDGNKA
jgi:mannose/fructose/N-acetylgalactosamine-specific phosphotransferase system component IIC